MGALIRSAGIAQKDHPILLEARDGYHADRLELPEDRAEAYFRAGEIDADGQAVDRRPVNSWVLRLHEVSGVEMLETQLVGAIAPFLFNSQMKPHLLRSPFPRRFIVNVSAMEGQFQRESKTAAHPHTNMAKAALNMMTRTSAADYAQDGIYMNSVDTGWITEENPLEKGQRIQERTGFHTPLDVLDGMARVYDPIVRGVMDEVEPLYGHFLKDYQPYPW
jgi:NAD(P)-dependent dehydrogenase (short-subunit alcohol dehydrogenase family)